MKTKNASVIWVVVVAFVLLIVAGLLLSQYRGAARGIFGGGDMHIMLPAGKGPHTHFVDLDETGHGTSTETMKHRHSVDKAVDVGVIPTSEGVSIPPHVHDISKYIEDRE